MVGRRIRILFLKNVIGFDELGDIEKNVFDILERFH
ncbi:MAG: hypothetical protein CM1200mP18_07890 [Gammaproteobacteria bacterium]|nr:MAG: hypothetical protein CM1200mP18_07890 [Gammaproteobacteria bacterium]